MIWRLIACLALLSFAACQSNSKEPDFYPYSETGERLDKPPAPKAQTSPYAESVTPHQLPIETTDVPIPHGFQYLVKKSLRNHTNFQAAKLRYERRSPNDDLNLLVKHFETELPTRGWTVEFVVGRRTRRILAHKPGKDLEIVCFRKYRTSKSVIIIKESEGQVATR